ncbi:MAG TPA: sigma-70 family RNA polymerase sigma factor [Solirubrobacterales bacterium]|jgi:RNA polymerase sigma-70 factor (ECF subfamily)|nr:sigma-70 family RNA polymerase sigma factor [Solirubrobacterales bacterium]
MSMRGDFGTVYDEELGSIYGFFAYRVASVADAEELTQRTFERALRAWDRFDPERAPLRTWLLAIGRNLLIDHYRADVWARRQAIEEVPEGELGSELPEPDLGIEPELASALAELVPRDREVLALRFGGDLSGPEIATVTGLSLANVQQILSRSLRRLRDRLEDGELSPRRAG